MNKYAERIGQIRSLMQERGWDAVIISGTDPHSSEYPAPRWQQVCWACGFTGEAGDLAITMDHAGLWTDSRYFIQAVAQLEGTGVELHKTRQPDSVMIPQWLADTFAGRDSMTVAVDGLCQSVGAVDELKEALNGVGGVVADVPDMLDGLWTGRPCIPSTPIVTLSDEQAGESGGKLINFGVLKRPHLRNGVIAQFFYNGGQTAVNSLFLVYCMNYVGMSTGQATTFFGIYMLCFLLGRWIGTTLMVKFRPQDRLAVYGIAAVVLCAVVCIAGGKAAVYAMLGISFFMSIMYPTQFSLAISDLGADTKSGSAFLVMAIVGNSIIPILTAYIQKSMANPNVAYLLPMVCFAVCAWYGWKGYKQGLAK